MRNTFDEIMDYYHTNKLIYQQLLDDSRQDNNILPFVGDALSVFAFGDRNDFIDGIIRKAPNNEFDPEKIFAMDFLDVLDNLIDKFGKTLIDTQLLSFYADSKIDDRLLINQPIGLIPYINNGNCITGSMDHVIDHSYLLAHVTADITSPFEHRKVLTYERGQIGGTTDGNVIKLHGDFLSDPNRRILTKSDYNEQYGESSDFASTLMSTISHHILLYIGVDIHKDKYLFDLMEKMKRANQGIYHYAIVGCNDSNKESIYKTLTDINILPILYNEEQPNSLEIIIHKMLADTSKSFSSRYKDRELDYKYSQHPLIGRDDQIEELNLFLNSNFEEGKKSSEDFKWVIIYGEGYTGKSRLAYDFARLYAKNWDWYVIDPDDIGSFIIDQIVLQESQKRRRKILIIFDDFDWYNGQIANIFNFEKKIRIYSEAIRFIFIIYDYRRTALTQKFFSNISLEQKEFMFKTAHKAIRIKKLSEEEIRSLCYEFLYYRANEINISDTIEQVISVIDLELRQYIHDLYERDEQAILHMCQLKVISLVKQYLGEEYLTDAQIAEAIFKMSVSAKEITGNLEDFDYTAYFSYRKRRGEIASETKEYYNNLEINSNVYNTTNEEELIIRDILEFKSPKNT